MKSKKLKRSEEVPSIEEQFFDHREAGLYVFLADSKETATICEEDIFAVVKKRNLHTFLLGRTLRLPKTTPPKCEAKNLSEYLEILNEPKPERRGLAQNQMFRIATPNFVVDGISNESYFPNDVPSSILSYDKDISREIVIIGSESMPRNQIENENQRGMPERLYKELVALFEFTKKSGSSIFIVLVNQPETFALDKGVFFDREEAPRKLRVLKQCGIINGLAYVKDCSGKKMGLIGRFFGKLCFWRKR